jgi:hypothetical protein
MRSIYLSSYVIAILLLQLLYGCSGEESTRENKPPTVWIANGPSEGSLSHYYVQFFWGGRDPDGEITHYQYVITDNPPEGLVINDALFKVFEKNGVWSGTRTVDEQGTAIFSEKEIEWDGIKIRGKPVFSDDSTFMFSADLPVDPDDPDQLVECKRSHTFFIRSVDDQGKPTPDDALAYRSFTAQNLAPMVFVTRPGETRPGNPAMIPPTARFTWDARDYLENVHHYQDPDFTRWILVPYINDSFDETLNTIRTYPDSMWEPWRIYDSNIDSTHTADFTDLDPGYYVFVVQAKDEASAITPVYDEKRNVRRVLVNISQAVGPALTVYNKFIGSVATVGVSAPFVIFDFLEGIPLEFLWVATADHYGRLVTGYRYGWDIMNLNDDKEWEIDFTPFHSNFASSPPRTFFYGTHTFYVEVVDDLNKKSRMGIRVNIIPFNMEKDLLLVDDFPDGAGIIATKGALPSDQEHDDFWISVLSDVQGFNPQVDCIEVNRGSEFPIDKIAQYKSIIWDVYGWYTYSAVNTPTLLYQLIRFYRPEHVSGGYKLKPNLLALYLEAGGHLLICGFHPMSMSINRTYFFSGIRLPFFTLFEAGGNQTGNYSRDGEIGKHSFSYENYCIDVLDIAYSSNTDGYIGGSVMCEVKRRNAIDDGARRLLPEEPAAFPAIDFNPVVTQEGYAFQTKGFDAELYNPEYMATCMIYGRDNYPRDCFETMYRQSTGNPSSVVNGAPIAIWTRAFDDVISPNGVPARSAIWGFEPYYFNRTQVKQALDVILFDEWKLTKKQAK